MELTRDRGARSLKRTCDVILYTDSE